LCFTHDECYNSPELDRNYNVNWLFSGKREYHRGT